MTPYLNKYHIAIDGNGYIISNRTGKQYYQKKRAPTFVSKYGGGDASYRDATFWQFWAQINWRNGSKQLKADDAGKFWKSSNVDVSQLEQVSLSRALVSAGQVAAGVKINCMAAWRSSQSWWNGNYGYRKQITITAPVGKQLPVGYPIIVTENSATIETATHVRSDRKDWRVVYWNGSTLVDLSIDYVTTTRTVFALQATIAAGATENNYYLYYGYAAESTTKIASSESEYNAVYAMYGATMDANTVSCHHFYEGTGTTLTDSHSTLNFTLSNNTWNTTGVFGRSGQFRSGITKGTIGTTASYNLGSCTFEAWVRIPTGQAPDRSIFVRYDNNDVRFLHFGIYNRKIFFQQRHYTNGPNEIYCEGNTTLAYDTWYHIAATGDGSGNLKVYLDGIQDNSTTVSGSSIGDASAITQLGRKEVGGADAYNGDVAHLRVSNAARSSFPYAVNPTTVTVSQGSEITTQPPTSSFDLYVGASNGIIYKWDGTTTLAVAYDTSNVSVNCVLVTDIGGTQKMYWGTGDTTGITNGNAKLFTFDGSTWAAGKVFNTATESVVTSLAEFNSKVYAGVGPQAKIYETADVSTWTLSKRIKVPQYPGYVNKMVEYNSRLYAFGGSPEFLPTKYYNGFLYCYDGTTWYPLYPFDHTVGKSMDFYDAYLFLGTYHGQIYVYDTATLNPLFSFKDDYAYQETINDMKYYDDKLYLALYPQAGSNDTNTSVWCFERHGMSSALSVAGVTGYRCFAVVNNTLMVGTGDNGYVYKLDTSNYATTGWVQSSYFDANLPSIDKLYNAVDVLHDPLVSGQSIAVYYKFKEADSWTLLGTSNTVGGTHTTLSFTSGIYAKAISLKYELNTTNTTTTPVLKEAILKYALYPARKWMWTMRLLAKENLHLLDKTVETNTATQIRTALENSQNLYALNTFIDIDGTSHTVLFNDIDQSSWVVNQNTVNEDEVVITLLEA